MATAVKVLHLSDGLQEFEGFGMVMKGSLPLPAFEEAVLRRL